MSAELPIASAERATPPVFRIAVPSFGRRAPEPQPKRELSPKREEFQRLLDTSLKPADLATLQMTRAERRQLAIARRVRDALYGSATAV